MYNNYNPYNPYFNYIQPQPQPLQQFKQSIGLQGKSVDSLDVVKAIDIPLDGTISYFPIIDGSAIVTKQLQQDGTSKTIIYKPVENENIVQPKYITEEQLNQAIKNIDNKDIKDEIKTLKRQIRDLSDEINDKKED